MTYFDNSHKKIRCKYCGSEADVDTSVVLTSLPPQYNVDCPKCGRVYMFCSEVNGQLL
jgi:ribosomal protein S27E